MHVLDNPIWNSLRSRQAQLAEISESGLAGRYHPEVSPFCAVREMSGPAWQSMGTLLDDQAVAIYFLQEVPKMPDEWELLASETLTQYVADQLVPATGLDCRSLGMGDLAQIMPLIKETDPGPFGRRTLETGEYIGVSGDNGLMAMAGMRMRCPGWSEVSAVCVHPLVRRQGLAAKLTLEVASRIRGSGDEAFLHVREGNDAAHALYRKLGFRVRTELNACVYRYHQDRD